MFYNELEPNDESPTPRTTRAPVLEEEEEGGTHDLRNLLDRKRQKKETNSLGSRESVVVRELGGRQIYRSSRYARLKCTVQEDPRLLDCMMAQEKILEDLVKEAQIQPEEELEKVNLGAGLGS